MRPPEGLGRKLPKLLSGEFLIWLRNSQNIVAN